MRDLIRQKIVDALAMPVPKFTRRSVHLPDIPGKAMAVIGPRRAGKTTFLWQVLADRLKSGVSREGLLYFSFEDERLADMKVGDLQWVIEEYYALNPEWRDRRQAVFFLDEIQVVPGWEGFVRRVMDTERVEIFLSGSSARLLSREVATQMRGRAMETLILPFSFREYLRHTGAEPAEASDRWTKSTRSTLENRLREYLTTGGYPEAQGLTARDRMELLRGYVDTALFRDVVERHAVSNPVALRWMVRHLLGNAAGTFSVQRFHGDLRSQGIPASKDTLHAYVGYLEDAFLIRALPIATDSERRRMVNPRKAYPVDPGLIPVFDRSGRANEGHALETVVALELERRGAEAAYVRTREGFEVDFLARFPDGAEQLIQVCADLDAPGTREREVRALLSAAGEHPRATLHLVALASSRVPIHEGIRLHVAGEWLLQS
jgi:predicted AAA+ superfamily ATPase